MKYKIFEVDFNGWARNKKFECINVSLPSKEEEIYVSDQYASHDSFGFYIGDDENAYDHACDMVRAIKDCEMDFLPDGKYRGMLVEHGFKPKEDTEAESQKRGRCQKLALHV